MQLRRSMYQCPGIFKAYFSKRGTRRKRQDRKRKIGENRTFTSACQCQKIWQNILLKIGIFVHNTKLIGDKNLLKKRYSGLVKSRQKSWRESRSRETDVGEKIAVTNRHTYISDGKNTFVLESPEVSKSSQNLCFFFCQFVNFLYDIRISTFTNFLYDIRVSTFTDFLYDIKNILAFSDIQEFLNFLLGFDSIFF